MKQSIREQFEKDWKKENCSGLQDCIEGQESDDLRHCIHCAAKIYDYSEHLETLLKTERPKAKKIVAEYLKELSPVKKRNEFEKGVAFGMNYLKTRLKLKGE